MDESWIRLNSYETHFRYQCFESHLINITSSCSSTKTNFCLQDILEDKIILKSCVNDIKQGRNLA